MRSAVVSDIPVGFSLEELARRLHVSPTSPQYGELARLVEDAASTARPKALGGIAYVDEIGEDYVVLDGVRFQSRVLAVNLAQAHRVFPYIATSGVELDDWASGLGDFLHRYWSEAIREAALRVALAAITEWVDREYRPGQTARMNPGSLADWPIEQQAPLFKLLGGVERSIGVRLTETMLMIPSKSVSGIRFATAESFESCMLCPRNICPGRRSPYDPELYSRRFGQAQSAIPNAVDPPR